MKKILKKYILIFVANSFAYLIVDSFEKAMYRTISEKLYIGIAIVAVLSAVSLCTDWISKIVVSLSDRLPISRIVFMLILIMIVSVLIDVCLLSVMSDGIESLQTSLLDRFMLAFLCQMAPLVSVADLGKKT